MHWWIAGLRRFQDRMSSFGRITCLLAALFCSSPSDGIKEQIVLSNSPRRTDHRSPRPVCPEGAWSNGRYLDAEAAHFVRQHFRYAFESEFAARVIGDAGQAHISRHRGNVDDMPAPPLAHEWQHRLDHRDCPENVDVELTPHLLEGTLLKSPFVAVPCTVDKDVYRTNISFCLRNLGTDGCE